MKISKQMAVAVALVAAGGVAVPTFASNTGTTKTSSGTQTKYCGDANSSGKRNTVALTGPEVLWPPNHQFVNESATATDKDNGSVMLTITPTSQDVSGGDGGPRHDPDYQPGPDGFSKSGSGSVTVPFQLRAERAGGGAGRTYTIDWMASFSDGSTCKSSDSGQSPFIVTVPHDQRKK